MEKKFADLTEDVKAKAELQKVDDILAKEENMEKLSKMTTPDEVIAFFEENGFKYTDEMKAEIKKFADQQSSDGELSEDDLAGVAGGWSWEGFGMGSGIGGLSGIVVGGLISAALLSNPVGWAIGGCAVGAAALGTTLGVICDD